MPCHGVSIVTPSRTLKISFCLKCSSTCCSPVSHLTFHPHLSIHVSYHLQFLTVLLWLPALIKLSLCLETPLLICISLWTMNSFKTQLKRPSLLLGDNHLLAEHRGRSRRPNCSCLLSDSFYLTGFLKLMFHFLVLGRPRLYLYLANVQQTFAEWRRKKTPNNE